MIYLTRNMRREGAAGDSSSPSPDHANDGVAHIKVGAYYEIDLSNLYQRSPEQLKPIRIVMVSKKTANNVSLRFPSMCSLRSYFDRCVSGMSQMKPERGNAILPVLDESHVMESERAGEVLYRRIPPHEISMKRNSSSVWVCASSSSDLHKSSRKETITWPAHDTRRYCTASRKGLCRFELESAAMIKGYNLWYFNSRGERLEEEPVHEFLRTQRRMLTSDLQPCTEDTFHVISFTELSDSGHFEANCFTKSIEILQHDHYNLANHRKEDSATMGDQPSDPKQRWGICSRFKVQELEELLLELAEAREGGSFDFFYCVETEKSHRAADLPSGPRGLQLNIVSSVLNLNEEFAPSCDSSGGKNNGFRLELAAEPHDDGGDASNGTKENNASNEPQIIQQTRILSSSRSIFDEDDIEGMEGEGAGLGDLPIEQILDTMSWNTLEMIINSNPEGEIEVIQAADGRYARWKNHLEIPHGLIGVAWHRAYGDVRDQGDHDTCWAFASTELVSAYRWIKGYDNQYTRYSPQELVDFCEPGKESIRVAHRCYLLNITKGLTYIQKKGVPKEEGRPYVGCWQDMPVPARNENLQFVRIKGVKKINVYTEVFDKLRNGPIGARLAVFSPDFQRLGDEIYHGPAYASSRMVGFHAVQIIDVGEEDNESFFWIRMSSGIGFGVGGHIRVSIDAMFLHIPDDDHIPKGEDEKNRRPPQKFGAPMRLIGTFRYPELD